MTAQDIKILGVTVTYNNEDKIPYVMPYYERMGIDKLVVYDNGSTDKTVELLSKYPFVEIRSYHTDQYSEELVLKYKTDIQNEFRGQYHWCISTYFDEVFYTERDFREVLYEKMCEGRTVFVKTGLNIFSRHFPPTDNGKLIHENVGRGALWTSDDGVVGIYGNKAELFDMRKVFVNYNEYGCHNCEITGEVSEFEDDIAFFHLKFIDYDFIVRSNKEYANRMGNNGIVCYDYFDKHMESVYDLLERRAISVEKYMKSTMKEIAPEQVIFLINETDDNRQKEIISDLKAASESTIERQFGVIFYGSTISIDNDIASFAMNGKIKILTYFVLADGQSMALSSFKKRLSNNYILEEPWVCETDGSLFKDIDFFKTMCSDLKKETLNGYRDTIINGHRFVRYNRMFSQENNASLGCYMIVKDEESNIKHCLDSIIDFCDEIVVVDTGCSDKTMEIAKSYGSKIKTFEFAWVNDFSAARNFAMSKLHTDYAFTTDADEIFTKELRKKILDFKQRGFDGLDCIDIFLLNYNGSDNINTYLGGRQIVRNYPENIWKYRVHEKLYFKRDTFATIGFDEGYILHKHKDSKSSRSNYNNYAEWYYKDINEGTHLSKNNSAHYFYYLFYTLRYIDTLRAKETLCEIFNQSRIASYTEDQRANVYIGNYIGMEELLAFELMNTCTDSQYMAQIAETFKEDLPKYLLLHKSAENGIDFMTDNMIINLSFIAYHFGLMDEFIEVTERGYELYKDNKTLQYNHNFIMDTLSKIYHNTLLIYSKNGKYVESAKNYFSHMFEKVLVTDELGVEGDYLIDIDSVGQIDRTTALSEYLNLMFKGKSSIIQKIGG